MSRVQSILALVVVLLTHVGIGRSAVAQVTIRPAQTDPSIQFAESRGPAVVRYEGWSAAIEESVVRPAPAAHSVTADPSVRHVAYYQTQGSLSDLPVLPPENLPAANFNPSSLPQLPGFSYGNGSGAGAVSGNSNARNLADQSQVLPPSEIQPPPYGARDNQYPAPGYGSQGLDGRSYVTPAPRTGRYPTSPYIGPRYQSTNHQLQTVPAQTVSTQNGLSVPKAMAAAAQPAVLPQDRSVVGIYPTAYQQCAPGAAMNVPATGAVPGTSVPPVYPPNLTPGLYSPNNSGYSPLFSLGQDNYNVVLGRGLIGQPTVYVPGQPFRNFFRYISP